MFLSLNHQKLDVYQTSRSFVLSYYKLTKEFPMDEKYSMVSQIRRAALSVHRTVAEGSSRKSETERKRFFEIARSSVVEIDAAFDIANDLGYIKKINLDKIGELTVKCFKLLSALIKN